MWVQVAGVSEHKVVLFDYDPSGSGSVPERLLARYQGYLQTDGYEGYAAPRCQGSCRLITFT
jgi:hypothetical protein